MSNLPCNGMECEIDTVRVVQVSIGDEMAYYEYIPAPCVFLSYYVSTSNRSWVNPWNVLDTLDIF